MKRTLVALAVATMLSGCAGLHTAWVLQLQMRYVTPDEEKPAPVVPALPAGKAS